MKYEGRTLEEALDIASKEEYVNKEDLVYSVVSNEEDKVEIEVYTIVDVIEYAQKQGIKSPSILINFDTHSDIYVNRRISKEKGDIL